ncbi:MAG: excinuclease ABC subunit UvrC [Ruminococcaceae bacterium]|nr:excinuclease ABC subunit UvrC [Oscillospiraceae bacterium]
MLLDYKIKSLPEKSGVYIMKNADNEVIYVGKAKVLKNRVRQYFTSSNHSPKVSAMVSNIKDFEYIITDSETEALVLECNLIKQYMPKYNILLKDDKTYPFARVSINEKYPRITMVRSVKKDGARYFGPYSSSTLLKELLEFLKEVYKLRTCNKVFPKDFNKSRTCLYYHIGKCDGVCKGDVDEESYNNKIKEICTFLSGKTNHLEREFEEKMYEASNNLDFEKAAWYRDKLLAIGVINQKQKATSALGVNSDILAVSVLNGTACVQVFFMRNGKIIGRENYFIENVDDTCEDEILNDFTSQYYSQSTFIPDEVIIEYKLADENVISQLLNDKKGKKVEIKVPKIGDSLKLINLVKSNAKKELQNRELKILRDIKFKNNALVLLKNHLLLNDIPKRIEAFDISGFAGRDNVAAMVVFVDAKPKKSDYRLYKIKSVVDKNDDYGAMREVLTRRYSKKEKLPDLIFVDGGLGHVNVAIEVLNELNLDINVFGIFKDDKHNTCAVMSKDGEIKLEKTSEAFMLLVNIQDEMHRRAISYYRSLSEKNTIKSELDDIKGIGERRKKDLISHFKTIKKIKNASVEELMEIKSIDKKTAQNIKNYFEQQKL